MLYTGQATAMMCGVAYVIGGAKMEPVATIKVTRIHSVPSPAIRAIIWKSVSRV